MKSKLLFHIVVVIAPFFVVATWLSMLGYGTRKEALYDLALMAQTAFTEEADSLWRIKRRVQEDINDWCNQLTPAEVKRSLLAVQPSWVKSILLINNHDRQLFSGTTPLGSDHQHQFLKRSSLHLDPGKWSALAGPEQSYFLMIGAKDTVISVKYNQADLGEAILKRMMHKTSTRVKYLKYVQVKLLTTEEAGANFVVSTFRVLPSLTSWDKLSLMDDGYTTGALVVGWSTLPFVLDILLDVLPACMMVLLVWAAVYLYILRFHENLAHAISTRLSSNLQTKIRKHRLLHITLKGERQNNTGASLISNVLISHEPTPFVNAKDAAEAAVSLFSRELEAKKLHIINKITHVGDNLDAIAITLGYLVDKIIKSDMRCCQLTVGSNANDVFYIQKNDGNTDMAELNDSFLRTVQQLSGVGVELTLQEDKLIQFSIEKDFTFPDNVHRI